MNEQEVRNNLIDPSLRKAGWSFESQIELEKCVKTNYEFTDGAIEIKDNKATRNDKKRCDYLLN